MIKGVSGTYVTLPIFSFFDGYFCSNKIERKLKN